MPYIRTVLGDISPGMLGFCQSHEHIFIDNGFSAAVNPSLCIDDWEKSCAELTEYAAHGGGAIVDAQPVGCGRNIRALASLMERSGVHIVASTGFHKLTYYPPQHWIFRVDYEGAAELFLHELQVGAYEDGQGTAFPAQAGKNRVGQIKIALCACGVQGRYETLFRAAAYAAVASGAALMVHVDPGSDPIAAAAYLQRQGVRPERILYCHMDRSIPDTDLHRILCSQGSYMEYDTVCRPRYHSDEAEIQIIRRLLEQGYGERILLSEDTTRARLRSYGGTPGLAYMLDTFCTKLRDAGIPPDALRAFFYDNPARAFALPGQTDTREAI